MKETRFIAQNKEKWQESENLLKESEKDPEKLSNLFTQVIDDLSYSRTYYPNRSVRVYLNRIAREYFSIIYKHHRHKKNTFRQFWLDELPQIVYQSWRPLLISLIIFFLAFCIGVFSSVKDPEFTASILGDRYVEMTKANIEKGDPMAVYKEAHEVEMFLGITLNNLMVAFRTYVFGVFLSIGTIAILLFNGVMVGCFQFFFIERGLFAESALTIWLHGTLEISSIVLAGGAGLTLGSGLLFPGSYSRLQAFQLSAIRSLKLMLGITPIFILAAIIESFVTRYTETPDLVRLALILLSAFFIVGYFVVYPWIRSRQGFEEPLEETKLAASREEALSFVRIKNNGEIVKDSFTFYKKYARRVLPWVFGVTIFTALGEFVAPEERIFEALSLDAGWTFLNTIYYALKTPYPVYILINTLATSVILYCVLRWMDAEAGGVGRLRFRPLAFLQTLLVVGFCYAVIYLLGGWGTLLVFCFWSFAVLLCIVQHSEKNLLPAGLSRLYAISSGRLAQIFGLQFVLALLSFSFLIVVSAPIVYMNTSILEWNFSHDDDWSSGLMRFITIFARLLAFHLVLPIFAASLALLYFSLKEMHGAENLKKSIAMMADKYAKRGRR